MKIKNPFIEDSEVQFEKEISKERLIQEYKKTLNIDISRMVSSIDAVNLYKCTKSGYRFFYPFDIAGDSNFYQALQKNDWYYMPWKWEYEICKELISEGNEILDVGCGKGDFIKNIVEEFGDIRCVGLELNESSVMTSQKYKILNTTVEDFSIQNEGQFDLVCSFQVLEHISNVRSFLKANVKCLKKNGLLVVSVPNNDSFIRLTKFGILNMPPHHMGLWTENSLKTIGEYFGLELVKVSYEPLQEYHFDYYLYVKIEPLFGNYFSNLFLKGIDIIGIKKIIKKQLKKRANNILGHTILIVFRKKT